MKKLTVTALAISSAAAFASPTTMETTLVTASRTQQTIDATLAPVTVIEREDIERAQARDVLELLSTTTGITITRNGGVGASSSVFIRGNASTHTLVLIDGQRVGSATLGSTNLSMLEPEQIERIEIVRGPRSSLYGSDAIGGVIQIFTRKGSLNGGVSPLLKAGYGNKNTSKAVAGLSIGDDAAYTNLMVTHFDTQGIDNLESDAGVNGDDDAYRTTGMSLRSGAKVGIADLALSYQRTDSENEYDSAFSPNALLYSDSVIESASAEASIQALDNWVSTLRVGKSKDDSLNLNDLNPATRTRFTTRRDSALWQNDLHISNHIVSIGAEYYDEFVDSTTNYDVDERYNKAGFAQVQSDFGAHDLSLGGRHEDNEQFGSFKTWTASYGVDLFEGTRLIVSKGTGFKAPTFNQLYFPGFGNPNFVPEESENTEVEVRYSENTFGWSLSGFENDVENLIQYNPSTFTTDQISEAEIRGAELTVFVRVNDWMLNGNYTVLRPIDKASELDIRRRARRSATFSADRQLDRLSYGIQVRIQGRSYEDAANNTELSGFGLIDLRTRYQINASLSAQLSVKNLFDRNYETARGFNNEGLTSMLTLVYEPR
ncbi:vitamin B12 transporter [Litorivivens lipolytica]|uniref:Vitamin B12 transporter n=1 Tax=Litorivivens lipolytica TaxID=1524264 RepID=A0A7W4W652_9GAMM|nr:TonB-dependent receptor [Litorivivens lipolytica]MBB3048045.1 vitamin B12 transporter [Litorivivens lipolytica]